MSGKLDQSLDDILKTRRQGAGRRGRGGRRAPNAARPNVTVAPVGGVGKTARAPRANPKATNPVVPITGNGESKIIVSGLPSDVNEQQIKDYFGKTIGPVKRALLTYGPNGQSRGVATIIFNKPGSAVQAATQLNGVKVDNRPMKIEVIVTADQAPVPVPAKALGDRIAQPKSGAKAQPKPAAAAAGVANGTANIAGKGRNRARRTRPGKPKTKTAEELDAEMVDYFAPDATNASGTDANGAAAPNPAVQPAAGGDTMVEDEIM